MKYNRLLKSGVGLLLIAGALSPAVSLGSNTSLLYGEGRMFESLQQFQAYSDMARAERGAQGPVRTESMTTPASTYDGSLYDELKNIQSATSMEWKQPFGARGPIRSESMTAAGLSYDGSLYDELKNIQSTHQQY